MSGTPKLFSLLTPLTMRQRQDFGEARRELRGDPKVKEELVQDKKTKEWYLRYMKSKKKVAEIRFGKQELNIMREEV